MLCSGKGFALERYPLPAGHLALRAYLGVQRMYSFFGGTPVGLGIEVQKRS